MPFFRLFLLSIVMATVQVHAEGPRVRVPRAKLEPFLQEHCIGCHGPDKQKGQVRFDEVAWEITNNDSAQRWQDVLDVLNGGDMPPEDEPQPPQKELETVLESLTGTLLTARQRLTASGGEIAMRRLNQREYAATIRELFGLKIPLDAIPEDAEGSSFDTVGADQLFTSAHFEKYLELGREIVATGIAWAGKPRMDVLVNRREQEERVTPRLRETLADLDNKMRMKNEGKTWQEMGFKDEGEAEIVFSQFKNRAGKPRQYLQYPLVESGVYLAEVNNESRWVSINRGATQVDPRGSYVFRLRAGVNGNPPEIRQFARIDNGEGPMEVIRIRGTTENPTIHEIRHQPHLRERNLSFFARENRADIRVLDGYLNRVDRGGEWASLWIDWAEIEGPFYPEGRAFVEKLVFPEPPVKGRNLRGWNDGTVRDVIEPFAFEAFRRRAPDAAYVDKLVALYQANRSEGLGPDQALTEVLAVVLASPGFLFLQEAEGPSDKPQTLDARELAIRLSYFLWSAPPDEELYATTPDGSLLRPEVLTAQVDRLLDSPKAEVFMEGFASQWAELDRFDAITVNEEDHFHFNRGVRLSAAREVVAFFKTLVDENLPASNWIDSDFVVVNSLLAHHYGLEGADSDEFQKVSLPPDSPRGGLLGQTAFLMTGSNGERSSPVIRGALVMEKLLHDKPPPPPPNVPELGSNNKTPLSNRQLVEQHQGRAQCASCHKKMDAIGFGLENFDTIGRWREMEKSGRWEFPIETAGLLPGGGAFSDLDELKRELLKAKRAQAKEFLQSLLEYGLGRRVEFSDEAAVEALLDGLQEDDYPVRSMIHAVVANALFHTK